MFCHQVNDTLYFMALEFLLWQLTAVSGTYTVYVVLSNSYVLCWCVAATLLVPENVFSRVCCTSCVSVAVWHVRYRLL